MNDETKKQWAEISAVLNPAKPKPQQVDAPGFGPGFSDAARATASELYGKQVMGTAAGALSIEQREFLRAAIAAWKLEDGNE